MSEQNREKNRPDYPQLQLDGQICFPLYACARKVISAYNPLLKPFGLTYTQYIVFLVLWEKDGISVTEIGEKLMLDNGTLSPLLKKMEQAGYITRHRSREDERVVVITLTEAGKSLQDRAREIPQKVAGCVNLPPEKARMLYTLLYELLDRQNRTTTEGETENENSL